MNLQTYGYCAILTIQLTSISKVINITYTKKNEVLTNLQIGISRIGYLLHRCFRHYLIVALNNMMERKEMELKEMKLEEIQFACGQVP